MKKKKLTPVSEYLKEFKKLIEPLYSEVEASFAENLHVNLRQFLKQALLSQRKEFRERGQIEIAKLRVVINESITKALQDILKEKELEV